MAENARAMEADLKNLLREVLSKLQRQDPL
jgi:hypothetical protein